MKPATLLLRLLWTVRLVHAVYRRVLTRKVRTGRHLFAFYSRGLLFRQEEAYA